MPEARGYRLEWRREGGQYKRRAGRAGFGAWLQLSRPRHLAGLEPLQKVVLPSDVTRHQLDGLQPGTEYRLTLYTLLEGREVATPATVVPTGKDPAGLGECRV